MKPLVVFLLFGFFAIPALASLQTVHLKGRLICSSDPKKPAAHKLIITKAPKAPAAHKLIVTKALTTPPPMTPTTKSSPPAKSQKQFHRQKRDISANPNGLIQLWEYDAYDPDDRLGETFANSNGIFEIKGEENEFFSITPYLRITHNCGAHQDEHIHCYKIATIWLTPEQFEGTVYDMKDIDLANAENNSQQKCKKWSNLYN